MKIALVHDYLTQYGGAERVLEAVCEIFPEAPIYTLLYDAEATNYAFHGRDIRTSFLQRVPFARRHHRWFPLLMPLAIEQFDFSQYDLVLSLSASFGKGIITKPSTQHICYCNTPTRFLWDDSQHYIDDFHLPWPLRALLPIAIAYLRIWDQGAAMRVDCFLANSRFIQKRIEKYYHKPSEVLYPPVDTAKFSIASTAEIEDYFLMVGRLVTYKRFDLAIEVFNALGKPLKIIGDGPDRRRLQKMAKSNIQFLGAVSDYQLSRLYQRAQALIFPQEEDFGIVALESMAAGRPVIAYAAGGALETVIDGVTGILFDSQTEIALAQAIGRYYQIDFDPQKNRDQALRFDKKRFQEALRLRILD